MNTNAKAATRPQKTASSQTTKSQTQEPITDRRILLIDARNVLDMFCEAGTRDGYKSTDLLSYLEEVKKQVARVEQLLER